MANNGKKPVPKEVQQYYASGKRDRVAIAWLIAFGTLIVTVLLVLGIFFSGRWAWHKISHKNPTTALKPKQPAEPAKPSTPSTDSKPSQSSSSNSSNSNSQQPQTTNPAPATTTQQPSSSSTSQSGKITNTGPGQTVATFAIVSALGAVGHSFYLRRRTVKA